MSFLLERDALNGKSGSGFLKINGENHQMFGMKKFQSWITIFFEASG